MKKALIIVLVLLVILSPVIFIGVSVFAIPSQHRNSYVGYLNNKVNRLYGTEGEKIVVIGGSSVAFALDSELMQKELGKPVVNFGLYAALGTKLMLDLSRDAIKAGDVVILSPELDPQTLSLYFSTENTLNAVDDDLSLLLDIPSEHWLSLIGGSWRFAAEKLNYYINGEPVPGDIYNSASFNEYGDIKSGLRENNTMNGYYDRNKIVDLTPDIVDLEFIDYINEYVAYCESVGAKVYFNWCPINKASLSKDTDTDKLDAFSDYMKSVLDCEFLESSLSDMYYGPIIDRAYFYDSNFHLNDAGVIYYTVNLIDSIYKTFGITDEDDSRKYCDVEIPEPPELPAFNIAYPDIDENEKYFTYEIDNTGAVITGLTEEGKKQKVLTLPVGAGGFLVSSIEAEAFSGSDALTLVIPEASKCQTIGNGAFNGSKIVRLYIYQKYESVNEQGDTVVTLINPPAHFSSGFKIYVPDVDVYKNGYEWRNVQNLDTLLYEID